MKKNTILNKQELRKSVLETRTNFEDNYVHNISSRIISEVLLSEEYKTAKTIFCYVSFDKEVSTHSLIETMIQHNKNVCVPLCTDNGKMVPIKIQSMEDLTINSFGIMEPNTTSQLVSHDKIDLVIVPCICANVDGFRIGYGGGYYDRFLQEYLEFNQLSKALLLCYPDFLFDIVPHEEHDIPITKILY